jgi:hypothetical protein
MFARWPKEEDEPRPLWDRKGNVRWMTRSPKWWRKSERGMFPVYYPGGYKPKEDR